MEEPALSADMRCVAARPDLVIALTPGGDGRYRVRSSLRRWDALLSPEVAAVLVLASTPRTRAGLADAAERELGLRPGDADQIVSLLINAGCVTRLPPNEEDAAPRGWTHAYRYHRLTLDYPFHDYTHDGGGFQADIARMRSYSALEPDLDRVKIIEGAEQFPLPSPSDAARTLQDCSASAGRCVPVSHRELVEAILSFTFGVTLRVTPAWNGAPTLRRTSPSGGGRHPTESYVLILDGSLPRGWYHVDTRTPSLARMNAGVPTADELRATYPGSVGRADFIPSHLVVMTSRFGRNMYRYREPRTFRTVHMDVGHLAGTLVQLCHLTGVRCMAHDATDPARTERNLGLHWLEEGAQYAVALGPGAAVGPSTGEETGEEVAAA